MRRTEFMHNTPEQVAGYLDEAWRILRESDVPVDLYAAAFPEAIKLVAGKQITFEQVSPLGIVGPGMRGG